MAPTALRLLSLAFLGLATSCSSSYVLPGDKADLQVFTSSDIQAGFAAQATNPWPASIAIVRVQDPSYRHQGYGRFQPKQDTGRYSVVFAKEADEDTQVGKLNDLDQIHGVVSMNRLLLPKTLKSDEELRLAASRLQADLLLIYTFDTDFYNSDAAVPLTVVTLGLAPTRLISTATTCSALLMDTRTGYLYSVYESTERTEATSTTWGSHESADRERRRTEERAFASLVDEMVLSWPRVLERHSSRE